MNVLMFWHLYIDGITKKKMKIYIENKFKPAKPRMLPIVPRSYCGRTGWRITNCCHRIDNT